MTAERATFGLAESELGPIHALILHAYFGLRVERAGSSIGVPEIQAYLARFASLAEMPTDATIQRTLIAAGVAHRGRGQPAAESRRELGETPHPFLPRPHNTPRVRHRK